MWDFDLFKNFTWFSQTSETITHISIKHDDLDLYCLNAFENPTWFSITLINWERWPKWWIKFIIIYSNTFSSDMRFGLNGEVYPANDFEWCCQHIEVLKIVHIAPWFSGLKALKSTKLDLFVVWTQLGVPVGLNQYEY